MKNTGCKTLEVMPHAEIKAESNKISITFRPAILAKIRKEVAENRISAGKVVRELVTLGYMFRKLKAQGKINDEDCNTGGF